MKFIKTFGLFENENLEDEGGVYLAYFGSEHRVTDFTHQHAKDNKKDGPGILFSSTENDARRTGGPYVTEVHLDMKRVVPVRGSTKKSELLFLMNDSPDYKKALGKFDKQDPRQAFFDAVDEMIHGQTPHNVFLNIWRMFYEGDIEAYMKSMHKMNYDGCVVPMGKLTHYLVYNPKSIKLL